MSIVARLLSLTERGALRRVITNELAAHRLRCFQGQSRHHISRHLGLDQLLACLQTDEVLVDLVIHRCRTQLSDLRLHLH